MNLTDKQVYDVYNLIVNSDQKFLTALAKAAIQTMLEVQEDLFAQSPFGTTPPTNNDIREGAINFIDDVGPEFVEQVKKAIQDISFDANLKAVQTLNNNLTFK